jgi:hypothetical protein
LYSPSQNKNHALESLDAEDEHADANVGVNGPGATVYVWQNAEALLGLPDKPLKQLSASQPAFTVWSKRIAEQSKQNANATTKYLDDRIEMETKEENKLTDDDPTVSVRRYCSINPEK